ncbi:energy transducer TonB [Bartonella sp. CB60]|uniref:energy transducer TonB n=1 Tax=Bartonella sp. CB60 TaxID=3113619 RepID=UPI00300DF257
MNFEKIKRLSTLWVGAFIGAFSLHLALGAQFYFRSAGVSDGTFSPTIMLTFAQETIYPDVDTDLLDTNKDVPDVDSEVLQPDVSEQESEISESDDEVQPEEPEHTVEQNDLTVPKSLEKPPLPKVEHEVLAKKSIPQSKTVVKQRSAKAVRSSSARYGSNGAELEDALSAEWLAKVQAQLERQRNYVARQRTNRTKGTVQLEFRVREQGNIFSSRIVLSSGDQELDRLAMVALQRVGNFPPPPASKVNKIIRVSLIFS